ncbi:hypothetical protein GRI89_03820 [Altererythrobacter salegens]|uniref:Uncharacterized protein n=1 Tax=Croceibacterium salegens TaxID=1737568 RepID=A0A6I4ST07_9SPHN|nr:hypothetical protein [Croceibacterium salegens]MXO58669.1 hypothetical protein [Croceibacterium salegens]
MSEALRQQVLARANTARGELRKSLPPLQFAEVNDNQVASRVGERAGFEIPSWIWRTMVACYAAFLGLLLAATGGARAGFAIAISAVYVAMFFGTTRAMLRQAPPQPRSPLERPGGLLATIFGPLSRNEVVAQMLVVPFAIVLFGAAVLVVRLAVF